MDFPKIHESEYRFCLIMWEYEPVTAAQLVKLCQEQLGWKRTTTYTVIKRLGERGDRVTRRGASLAQQVVALGDRLRQRRRLTLQTGKCCICRGNGPTRLKLCICLSYLTSAPIVFGIHVANRIAHFAQRVRSL